jgi:uncharacterized membrane protein
MDEILFLLAFLAIVCVLCGPVALIISIIALNKSKEIRNGSRRENIVPDSIIRNQNEVIAEQLKTVSAKSALTTERQAETGRQELPKEIIRSLETKEPGKTERKKSSFAEQRIGTRWMLIAGIITVMFGVGFFLKYAYDNDLVGPLGRVIIAVVTGIIALIVGEVTRRRNYDIVAKGVTALGFAILYAAIFSSYRFYGLISATPAFAIAIFITAAAMLYAMGLNEVLIAFLSLLGGFLTPLIISTGQNLPMPLFSYALILGLGAMICAYYRKWQVVNLVAFIGTFLLYTGWFEKFYQPATKTQATPEQISIALIWLGIFFTIYLVMPILYELVNKIKARKYGVILVLANAIVTFYYLCAILFAKYRTELVFCLVGLAIVHWSIMWLVIKRCKEDKNLRTGLLSIGLFFITIAIPLYWRMYPAAMAWAGESVILALVGLKYRSKLTQLSAVAAICLSIGQLLTQLPLHTTSFNLVLNPAFGTWYSVAIAIILLHILCRKTTELPQQHLGVISQLLYAAAGLLLFAAAMMEWYWHCKYNIIEHNVGDVYFIRGMMLIFTAIILLFTTKPICPSGLIRNILATILVGVGSLTIVIAFPESYKSSFLIFANINFALAVLFVAGLFAAALLLKISSCREKEDVVFALLFALTAIFTLWVLLTEQTYLYWYCKNRYSETIANWNFLAHMYISIIWAVYGIVLITVGFWRKIRVLRYLALALFALLLVKIFIIDTATVKSVYRIAAFLATGATLVAVSYLYQLLKNRGFFETMPPEKP